MVDPHTFAASVNQVRGGLKLHANKSRPTVQFKYRFGTARILSDCAI